MELTLGFLFSFLSAGSLHNSHSYNRLPDAGSLSFPSLGAHSEAAGKAAQAADAILATEIDFKMSPQGIMGAQRKHLPFPACSLKETNSLASTLLHPTKHAQDLLWVY